MAFELVIIIHDPYCTVLTSLKVETPMEEILAVGPLEGATRREGRRKDGMLAVPCVGSPGHPEKMDCEGS